MPTEEELRFLRRQRSAQGEEDEPDERVQLEDEYRDWEGKCRVCKDYGCCEHAPCTGCFSCLGLTWGDFI